jgi:hypothetical protein
MKFFALSLLALPAAALAQTNSAPTSADQNGQQAQQSSGQAPAGERRVCRYEEDSTGRTGRRRICRTEAEWRGERD